MWMAIMAVAVAPLLAQEVEPSETEEEQQIDQAIDEVIISDQQQNREVQTLMSSSGGYGAFSLGYTEVNGLPALLMGLSAEWVLGHSFGLGIMGVGFTSDFTPVGEDFHALSGGYGGLVIEPIVVGWFPVHVAFPLLLGGGGMASYTTSGDQWDYDNNDPYFGEYAIFFVLEAGLELEFNLVSFFRLSMFGRYRWTPTLNMQPMYGLTEPSLYPVAGDALNGWSAGMRFKFGSF